MQTIRILDDLTPKQLELFADVIAERVSDRLRNHRRLLNRRELAELLGVSVPTIDRMMRDNELPIITVKSRKRFDPHEVIRHLAEQSRVELQIN